MLGAQMYVPVVTSELSFSDKVNRLRKSVKESRRVEQGLRVEGNAALDSNGDYESSREAQIFRAALQAMGKGALVDVFA